MRKSGKTTALVAVLLCGITGSLARHPIAAQAATPVDSVKYPVITRIVARHYTVMVEAGPAAAVYTITGDDGKRLTDHITLAAMKQSNPDLFNCIAPDVAATNADASVDTGF